MLLGASILEKHFTHDKTLPGNDHYHAMNKTDLSLFVKKAEKYRTMISGEGKDLLKESAAITHARRSIVANRDIAAGEIITEDMLIAKRPAHGISPIHWDSVIGMVVVDGIDNDELITWKKLK